MTLPHSTFFEGFYGDAEMPTTGGGARPTADQMASDDSAAQHASAHHGAPDDSAAQRASARVAAELALPRGHALFHPSGMRHGAHRITRGQRWVLVVFVLATHVEHAARRAVDLANAFAADGELQTAASVYEAALAMDPTDHETGEEGHRRPLRRPGCPVRLAWPPLTRPLALVPRVPPSQSTGWPPCSLG